MKPQRVDSNHDSTNGLLLQKYQITPCWSNSPPFYVFSNFLFQCQTIVESSKRHFKWQFTGNHNNVHSSIKELTPGTTKPKPTKPGPWQPYHDSSLAHCGCQMPLTACSHPLSQSLTYKKQTPWSPWNKTPWQCLSSTAHLGLYIISSLLVYCFSHTVFDCLINYIFAFRHPIGTQKS